MGGIKNKTWMGFTPKKNLKTADQKRMCFGFLTWQTREGFVAKSLSLALFVAGFLGYSHSASAVNLDWRGGYRFEWNQVANPSLTTPGDSKGYGLNYLYLEPKILASDGVDVVARFDVLSTDSDAYKGSQAGMLWGMNTLPNTSDNARTYKDNEGVQSFRILSQLYLNINNEYNAIVIGRAPFHFGLGMSYSAGNGAFDHWSTTKDMIAYKMIKDEWSFTPIIAKANKTDYSSANSLTDFGLLLDYRAGDQKSALSVYKETRNGSQASISGPIPSMGSARSIGTNVELERTSFYFMRDLDWMKFSLEGGFQSGQTGYVDSLNSPVRWNGWGIATEFLFPKLSDKTSLVFRSGLATGDDPQTGDYEGFFFNRNYNLGALLFNHRLGKLDLLGTRPFKSTALNIGETIDDEYLSNAFYISPKLTHYYSDRIEMQYTAVWAQLATNSTNSASFSKDLGIEFDVDVVYKPTDRLRWINELSVLFPGVAFGNNGDSYSTIYGLSSRAAVSF